MTEYTDEEQARFDAAREQARARLKKQWRESLNPPARKGLFGRFVDWVKEYKCLQ